jgi:iron complex outermembrane receptor protein
MSTRSRTGRAAGVPLKVAIAAALAGACTQAVAAGDADTGQLETVVVTAQKVTQSVQDVPISISAVSGEALERTHTVTLEALSGSVPNVQVGHFSNTPTSAVFNIRGMGVIEPDPYAGQTVTVVLDGVPQVFNMISLPTLFDIDRIEVLRGPQGTLFGANTTGGVINIVTRQPTGQSEGKAEVAVGNYDRLDANVALDFPISETVAGKLTALHHSEKGYVTNIMDGSSMGDQNVSSLRAYLRWTPSNAFDATLIQQVDQMNNGSPMVVAGDLPGEAEYVAPGTQVPGQLIPMYESPCAPNQPCRAPDHYYSAISHTPDKDKVNIYATTLTMNWHSSLGEIVSITGYKRFNENNYTDQDGGPLFLDDTNRITKGYQITQELRDTLKPVDGLTLLVGAYGSYDWYHHAQNFRIQFAAPGFRQLSQQDQIRRSYSAFAQAYWDVTPKLRIQAGVRGTEEKTRMIATVDNFINLTGPAVFTGDTPIPGGFVAAPPTKSWSNVGGKFGLDYKFTDDVMGYAYVARGFKSGGFTGRISIPQSIGPYDPEYVNTAEIGLKADWMDHRLRTNVAVFYNKYKDLQLAQIYFVQVNGVTVNDNTILNAANAETKGIELEINARPVPHLRLNLDYAYLSAKYTKFDYQLPTGGVLDLKGKDLQNAPHNTASASFAWEIPAGAGQFDVGAGFRYTGEKYFTSLLNTPRSKVQATSYLDANLDWTPKAGGPLTFSLWGRNVTNKHYIASVFDAPGTLGLVNYEPPREYGLTAKYSW